MNYKKVTVGAAYGTRDWIIQRISGLYIFLYFILFSVRIYILAPSDFYSWKSFFMSTWFYAATLLIMAAAVYHIWVGMRDVYMDYIKHNGLRLALEVCTITALSYYVISLAILIRS